MTSPWPCVRRPSTRKRSRSATPAPLPTGRCRRDHQVAQRRRPPPRELAPGPGRSGRASLRRAVHPGPGRAAPQRLRDPDPGRIVLTGTSKMEGAVELAEEIFHMPVRLGVPYSVKASPTWCNRSFDGRRPADVRTAETVRWHSMSVSRQLQQRRTKAPVLGGSNAGSRAISDSTR